MVLSGCCRGDAVGNASPGEITMAGWSVVQFVCPRVQPLFQGKGLGGWTGRVEGNWPAVPLTLSARTKGLVYIAVLPLLSLKPSTLPPGRPSATQEAASSSSGRAGYERWLFSGGQY